MKEHEQQTSRLEKISDFFGGRNFSRLNLYKYLSALAAVVVACCPAKGEENMPFEWEKKLHYLAPAQLLCAEGCVKTGGASFTIQPGGRAMFALRGPLNILGPRLQWLADGDLKITVTQPGLAETMQLGEPATVIAKERKKGEMAVGALSLDHERGARRRKWELPFATGNHLYFLLIEPVGKEAVTLSNLRLRGFPLKPAAADSGAAGIPVEIKEAADGYLTLVWNVPPVKAEPFPLELLEEQRFHDVPFQLKPVFLTEERREIRFEVNRKAGEFHFLHVSGDAGKLSPWVATYLLVYEDNSVEPIFAVNRWNCGVFGEKFKLGGKSAVGGDSTWWGPTGFAMAETVYLPRDVSQVHWNAVHRARYLNPHPEKTVRQIVAAARPGHTFALAGITLRTPEATRVGLVEPERATLEPGKENFIKIMEYSSLPATGGTREVCLEKTAAKLPVGKISLTAAGHFAAGMGKVAIPDQPALYGPIRLSAGSAVSSELGLMRPERSGDRPFHYVMIATGTEPPDGWERMYRLGYDTAKIHVGLGTKFSRGNYDWTHWPATFDAIAAAGMKICLRPPSRAQVDQQQPISVYRRGKGVSVEQKGFDPADPEARGDIIEFQTALAKLSVNYPQIVSMETCYGARSPLGTAAGNALYSGPFLWKKFLDHIRGKYTPAELGVNSIDEVNLEFVYQQKSGLLLEELLRLSVAENGSLQREVSEAVHAANPKLRQIFHSGYRDGEGAFDGKNIAEYLRIGRDLPPVSLTNAAAERYWSSFEQWMLGRRTFGFEHSDEACQNPPCNEHLRRAYMWMAAFQTREANFCRFSVGRPAALNIAWLKPFHQMIYNAEYRPDPVSLALSFDSSLADAPENGRNQRHIRQLNRFGLINTLRTLNINPDRYLVEEFPEMDGNVKSKLLIDDNNHKISDAFAGRIEKFIRNGGVFLASRDTDRKNNWRFFERFGIRFDGKTFTGCPVAEGLFPVAEKAVGKGKIVILGKSWPFTGFDEGDESPEYRAFMQKQLLRIGGFRPLVRSDVTAVCALPYRDADGSLLLYAVNLRCTPAKVTLGLNADALPQAAAVTDFRAGTVERPVKSKDGYWEQTLEIPPLSASLLRFN